MSGHAHGGRGSNQYVTQPGGDIASIHHRDGHDRIEAQAAWNLEDEPSSEDVADVFGGVDTWEEAFPGVDAHADREYYPYQERGIQAKVILPEDAWTNAGVKVPATARRLAAKYKSAGIQNPALAGVFYRHRIPPEEAAQWMPFLSHSVSQDEVDRIAAVRRTVTVDEVNEMVHRRRPLSKREGVPVRDLAILAADQWETDPAVLRRTIQNLSGCGKKQAARQAVDARGYNAGMWVGVGKDDYFRAACQPVWWRRRFHKGPWKYGE